jgi:acetylglutamate/LysW-gamma-L-alpha-aminoadipate kinase
MSVQRPIVVKAGGRLVANPETRIKILRNIVELSDNGKPVVFVHGGGDVVTEYSKRMGVEPRFVVSPSGIRSRYTGPEELEVYVMVMAGKLNKEIVAELNSDKVRAIGVTGADCGIMVAQRKKRIVIINERGRKQVIPGGYTGKIVSVNKECIEKLLSITNTVVVSPIALGTEGELLNVDGDQAASSIATAIQAEALVLLSDVEGVIIDGKVVSTIPLSLAEEYAAKTGYGMNRKILMAAEAVAKGVGKAVIAPGNVEDPVTKALSEETGTSIKP